MHCYDLMLRVPRGGRDSNSIVLCISGVNHHHTILEYLVCRLCSSASEGASQIEVLWSYMRSELRLQFPFDPVDI
jgi:hypothetical protein